VIAGVVLAAGGASRFGGPKQLAELDGLPLLEHAIRSIESVPAIERVVVVLGARADEVRAGVDFGATEVVVCDDWATGQSASLKTGIAAIADTADAVVITLGDMPRITPQVIARFADLAAEHGAGSRARAVYDGVPGHPVVLGSAYFDAVAAIEGDIGARELLRSIGVQKIECSHLCDAIDIDTPADLEGLQRG
jgi:CTP:molybdopterin cytidylyltransferase MocA